MKKIFVQTKKAKEIVDITDLVNQEILPPAADQNDKKDGLCHLFLTHTTAALTTADLDPGTDLDMLEAFEAMVPKRKYRHPHNPAHVRDHILSSLIGTSLTLPFADGKLILGTWQRVVLMEFNGPRQREIFINLCLTK